MAGFYINCDWGTTQFRLRATSADGSETVAEINTDDGAAKVAANGSAADRAARFRRLLSNHLERLASQVPRLGAAPILVSGMASASIGWHELPYAQVPWRLDGSDMVTHTLEPLSSASETHRVLLLSGLCTSSDVMRGEETQVLGLFQLDVARPHLQQAIVVLPGTHSKHVQVEHGAITGFQTYMTGEIFDVLGQHSILRHSIAPAASNLALPAQREAFAAGAQLAREVPLAAALFRVRTRQVLDSIAPEDNRSYLSGLLIGAELAHLAHSQSVEPPIVLCAGGQLGDAYSLAGDVLELTDRLHRVPDEHVERLSALGQVCVARRLADS